MPFNLSQRRVLSLAILAASVALAAMPWSPFRRSLSVAVGSELEQPMRDLETRFEQAHPDIDLVWRVQGSQDMVNQALENNAERPRVLIPASGELLRGLAQRLRRQQTNAGLSDPQPIARTVLVAVSWPERAAVLFGTGPFRWGALKKALEQSNWASLGGQESWGRFNLRATDPARSNSGQLAMLLWLRSQGRDQAIGLWRRALYQPPRSTDILLREFIATGPNDGDVAFVYESIALSRMDEARQRQGAAYTILAPDPSYETVLEAAVLEGKADGRIADGTTFIRFLRSDPQQQLLMDWGFRSHDGRRPQNAQTVQVLPSPDQTERDKGLRLWTSAQ